MNDKSVDNEDDDEDQDEDEFLQEAYENGETVFIHSWGSDNPGAGADTYSVELWEDKYVVVLEEMSGPYDSLDAAFKEMDGLLMITPATESIVCSELSGEEIAKQLWCESDDPVEFTINDEDWMFEKGKGFQKVASD